ncbi:murein biosynthesis integral membrane protein MurJ [Sphingomonas sp.]|uniref:murein biosynthesis integral membrane protein MurJ n=1 Tax=Sphingomonas sp. TaxID=28214 RepID=UPI003AFFE3AE
MKPFRKLAAASMAAIHPSSRAIVASGARVTALAIAAKLFTIVREVTLAYRYGTGISIDAFNMAFTIASWLPVLLVSTAATGLVPLLVSSVRDQRSHQHMVAELNAVIAMLAIGLCALAAVTAPWASALMTGATTSTTHSLTQAMIVRLAPVAGLGLVAGYLATRLQAQQRYLYTIGEAFPPIGISLGAIAPLAWSDENALITGLLTGTIVQIAFLAFLLLRTDEGIGGFSLDFSSPHWPRIRKAIGTLAIGAGILWITVPVEQAYAARLGAGAVASLNYANRLIGMGTSIAIVIIARALLPTFSRAIADGDVALARQQAWQWAVVCGVLGVVCAALGWVASGPAIRLLLQRGAFGGHDADVVADLVRLGIMQLPFFFASTAIVQWLAASGRYKSVSIIAGMAVIVKITLLQLLIPVLGLYALMLSTVGMYAFSLVAQVSQIRSK